MQDSSWTGGVQGQDGRSKIIHLPRAAETFISSMLRGGAEKRVCVTDPSSRTASQELTLPRRPRRPPPLARLPLTSSTYGGPLSRMLPFKIVSPWHPAFWRTMRMSSHIRQGVSNQIRPVRDELFTKEKKNTSKMPSFAQFAKELQATLGFHIDPL